MTEVYEDDATFKELPYYKAIFKSFLKRQIQHLLEELSDETGEESIILTANINNGTLSHLGSNTGKGFLQGRDDIKTQFLAYCLKTNHSEQTQVSTSKSPYLRPASRQNIPSPAEQPVVKRARMTRSSDIPNTASISSSLLSPNVVPGLSSVPAQPVCLYPALSQPYTVTAADSDYDVEDNTTTTVEEIKTESLEGTSIERNYTHSGASALTYSDSNVLDSHDSKSSLDKSRGSVDVGNSESGPNLQSEFSANESFDLSSVVIKQELKEGDNELGLSFGDPDKIPNDVSNTGEAESQSPQDIPWWAIHQFSEHSESPTDFGQGTANKHTVRKTLHHIGQLEAYVSMKNDIRKIHDIPPEELNRYLVDFVVQIRRQDGKPYDYTSLRNMIGSIERYLKNRNYPESVVHGPVFRQTMATMKRITKAQKQLPPSKPKVSAITDQDVNQLYKTGQLCNTNPQGLINTVWFNNAMYFGIRSALEHKAIKWGDIQLCYDEEQTRDYLVFKKPNKSSDQINEDWVPKRLYATGTNRCPVETYKIYAAHRPLGLSEPQHPLYLGVSPAWQSGKVSPWFTTIPTGVNKLGHFMSTMATKANIAKGNLQKLTSMSVGKYLQA